MATPSPVIRKDASVAVWGFVGMAAVATSYLFALLLGLLCMLGVPLLAGMLMASSGGSWILVGICASLFGLVAGFTILAALWPRKLDFQPKGVLLDMAKQPRLAAEVAETARSLNESIPSEVYLLPDANAYVAEPKGRERRILAIGLPLLQVMTVSELRGVLVHEFAHYYSGDTRLGPSIQKARESMVRVLQNLGKRSDTLNALSRFAIVAVLHMIVVGGLSAFWTGFLRLTQWISRRQELRSDELACTVAGSGPFEQALLKLNTANSALPSFWQGVVSPIVRQGYHPPLGQSFVSYLAHPAITASSSKYLEERIAQTSSAAYDTHPPLGARLAAVKRLAMPAQENNSDPATTLLDDLPSLESALLHTVLNSKTALKEFHWETAGEDVYIPVWRNGVAPFVRILSEFTLLTLPALVSSNRRIADVIPNPPGLLLNAKQRDEQAQGILSMAFALALIEHGWSVECKPGSLVLKNGEHSLVAWETLLRLRSGQVTARAWADFLAERGIEDWPLA